MDTLFYRLGAVIGWLANIVAGLCLAAAVFMRLWVHDPPNLERNNVMYILVLVAAVTWYGGRKIRQALQSDK